MITTQTESLFGSSNQGKRIDSMKMKTVIISAPNDVWAKAEAFRILKGYNKKQRGQALSELVDFGIDQMLDSDQEKFNEAYEKALQQKFGDL